MIDSHAHIAFAQFDEDRAEVIRRAKLAGVEGWIEVGTNIESSERAIKLSRQYDGQAWATVGIHPTEVKDMSEKDWGRLQELLIEKEVVAVGEVGIDLYRSGFFQNQLGALDRFIGLAGDNKLPIVFHVRSGMNIDANNEVIKLLTSYSDKQRPRGVMHSFSGTWQQAEKYLDLGVYLAFNGVVTFKNAGETKEMVRRAPLDKMLIETDCPYLAPDPHRGKRNEMAYAKLVAEKIADLKGVTVEEVAEATTDNTKRLFGLI